MKIGNIFTMGRVAELVVKNKEKLRLGNWNIKGRENHHQKRERE
jgi:hypothetical protein